MAVWRVRIRAGHPVYNILCFVVFLIFENVIISTGIREFERPLTRFALFPLPRENQKYRFYSTRSEIAIALSRAGEYSARVREHPDDTIVSEFSRRRAAG